MRSMIRYKCFTYPWSLGHYCRLTILGEVFCSVMHHRSIIIWRPQCVDDTWCVFLKIVFGSFRREKKLVFDEVLYLITHEMFILSLLLKFYFLLGHLIFVCFFCYSSCNLRNALAWVSLNRKQSLRMVWYR